MILVEGPSDQAALETLAARRDRDLRRSGVHVVPMARGFFVCVADLEDELIRSLGVEAVMAVVERAGDVRKFEVFQNQPEWRHAELEAQLHRFIGIRSGRKARYARMLVEALDPARVPHPLHGVLEAV